MPIIVSMTHDGDPTFSTLETPRLILRRFQDADLEPFVAYRAIPDVERYQGWSHFTMRDGEQFIQRQRALHPGIPGQGCQIAIELKTSSAMIGDCYCGVRADATQEAEIGCTIAPPYQRHAYAVEAVSGLLTYMFERLELARAVGVTDVRNLPSIKLLERVGFRLTGRSEEKMFKGELVHEYTYTLSRNDWIIRGHTPD